MSRQVSQPSASGIDNSGLVGVGLRHSHYRDALLGTPLIDFVEVHAENFFSEGGLAPIFLEEINSIYNVSLHATSMGPGSAVEISQAYLRRLKQLVDTIDPWLISDHACFSWGHDENGNSIHAGDLLPLEFNQQGLDTLVQNVDRIQQLLGRSMLIENISSYIAPDFTTMRETEFLCSLVERTQCRLLIDLNNLLVNAHNFGSELPLNDAQYWLENIPAEAIGEFHLAGCTPAKPLSLMIDDHAEAVSEECWSLYQFAIEKFGSIPTLIEWDNNLPTWEELLEQARKARHIIQSNSPDHKGQDHAIST